MVSLENLGEVLHLSSSDGLQPVASANREVSGVGGSAAEGQGLKHSGLGFSVAFA